MEEKLLVGSVGFLTGVMLRKLCSILSLGGSDSVFLCLCVLSIFLGLLI